MSRLEDLRPNAAVKGLLPDALVTVVTTQWFGSEALEIRLAHLFDPLLAVHTSLVDPLPHQITAVYESILL